MKRAITVEQLINKKFEVMQFEGVWRDSFGLPEMSGVWLAWGDSGNGKTRMAIQAAKYITQFGKVAYNTLEEGARLSMKRVIEAENIMEVSQRFMILHREPIEELKVRLRKRKSPHVVFIDSIQYAGLSKREYIEFKEEFEHKLLIFLSHAEGKHPEGRLAKFIRYDADVKLRIEGYKAFIVSRYGGGEDYIIWEEGAAKYWGNINNNEN